MIAKGIIRILVAGFAGAVPGAVAQQLCPPLIQWQQTYGGNSSDYAADLRGTSDGGFIIGGSSFTYSGNTGGGNKTAPFYGNSDCWVVRADSSGNKLWDKSYGGAADDFLWSLQQTTDGGFIFCGSSRSVPGGNKTSPNIGQADFWLVRTDSSGNKLWDQSFGGTFDDIATSVLQTSDGGYLVAGYSYSQADGNKTSSNFGFDDFWVVRTDANGQKLWDRSFGGTQTEFLHVARETSDGGFLLGGYSASEISGNKTSVAFGYSDGWVVRIDVNGNKLWDRSFGGSGLDEIRTLIQTADGSFLLGGFANSLQGTGNKTSASFGGYDFWVVNLDTNGNKRWDQTYGGGHHDILKTVNSVAGGFILGGSSSSLRNEYGTKTSRNYGGEDYWVVRIDEIGNQLWDQSIGSRDSDTGIGAFQTSGGGLIVGGSSYGTGGIKTSPAFQNGDFWVVKLGPETPGDCDGDGVMDAQDLCANTPPGTIVNANGCAIVQLCPCTNDWRSTTEYVRCVRDAAADFARTGLITEQERHALVEAAERTNCPPVREGIIVFGLTNMPIGEAELRVDAEFFPQGPVTVSELDVEGGHGVSVLTGEADSGIFMYPDAPIWGNFHETWFMQGRAFGRVNGAANSLVSSLRVTKPNYEVYPIDIDFTPLAPQSLTFQVFSNRTLVAQTTTDGATGDVTIYTDTYLGPRGNPFWRMPDGSVGALIEFTTPVTGSGEYYPNAISGPFGDVYGDRVFIRADQPANRVDFISRVDVTGYSGDFNTFSFLDERLGVFARPHKALGPVEMNAADGRLTIAGLTNFNDYFIGVLVELDLVNRFDANLQPLELADAGSSFLVSGSGPSRRPPGEGDSYAYTSFAEGRIRNESGVLQLAAEFSPEYFGSNAPSLLQVKVYRNGSLAGSAIVTNDAVVGTLTSRMEGKVPEIISAGVVANNSNAPASIALSFRHLTVFTATDGTVLRGNHLRVGPVDPAPEFLAIDTFSLRALAVPAFTITAESTVVAAPRMSVAASGSTVELGWPVVNQPFVLETAPSLSGAFSAVTNDVELINDKNCVVLPAETSASRFFRLRLSTD